MRSIILLFVITCSFSCRFGWGEKINGSGNTRSETRSVSSFNSVDVSGAVTVHVKQGAESSVRLETDDNLLPYLEVFTSGDRLVIRTRKGFNLRPTQDIVAYVSAPSYSEIEVSGAADIITDNTLTGDKQLSVSVSGSGNIQMQVDVPRMETSVSGDGTVLLSGQADSFEASVSGSGEIRCFDLVTESTSLELSGAANAEVHANKTLDVDVSGAGDVQYRGNPSVRKNISGAGSVKKAG